LENAKNAGSRGNWPYFGPVFRRTGRRWSDSEPGGVVLRTSLNQSPKPKRYGSNLIGFPALCLLGMTVPGRDGRGYT
jgi:hypothetical protein